jgi:hypothetical protein
VYARLSETYDAAESLANGERHAERRVYQLGNLPFGGIRRLL